MNLRRFNTTVLAPSIHVCRSTVSVTPCSAIGARLCFLASSYISASVRTNGSPSNGMIPSQHESRHMVRTGAHGNHSRRWSGQGSTGRALAPFAGWIGSSSSQSLRIGEVRPYTAASLHPDMAHQELRDFDYAGRGYPITPP